MNECTHKAEGKCPYEKVEIEEFYNGKYRGIFMREPKAKIPLLDSDTPYWDPSARTSTPKIDNTPEHSHNYKNTDEYEFGIMSYNELILAKMGYHDSYYPKFFITSY